MRQMVQNPAFGLETKFVAMGDLAEVTDGRIHGYASLFGEADQNGDVVMPGAFAASLAALARAGRKVKFLWQHDPTCPIGVWSEVAEDGRGLLVTGEILAKVSHGTDALALLEAGAIDGLSIGYRTIRAEPNPETGGRNLHEIDLWEVSLVTFPMLPTARAMLGAVEPSDVMELALAEALSV
ncbi:MAG: HK97 family phage prohead protease [Pseudomonadota bacterium]